MAPSQPSLPPKSSFLSLDSNILSERLSAAGRDHMTRRSASPSSKHSLSQFSYVTPESIGLLSKEESEAFHTFSEAVSDLPPPQTEFSRSKNAVNDPPKSTPVDQNERDSSSGKLSFSKASQLYIDGRLNKRPPELSPGIGHLYHSSQYDVLSKGLSTARRHRATQSASPTPVNSTQNSSFLHADAYGLLTENESNLFQKFLDNPSTLADYKRGLGVLDNANKSISKGIEANLSEVSHAPNLHGMPDQTSSSESHPSLLQDMANDNDFASITSHLSQMDSAVKARLREWTAAVRER